MLEEMVVMLQGTVVREPLVQETKRLARAAPLGEPRHERTPSALE